MPKSIGSRLLLAALGITLAGTAFIVLANFATSGRLRLQFEYALQERLTRYAKAMEVKVDSVPPLKMFLHPEDKVLTNRLITTGKWEPTETHWTTRLVRKGDTFVDIGANVGYYTLLASHLVGEEGMVFAFEPDPVNFRILEKNVRLNGLTNVVLEQKAVSNENGSIQLFLSESNKGDHRIYQTEEGRPAVDVEAVKLDDYFAGYSGSVDFVKIDTQGAEGVILEGMTELINGNDDIIIAVEYWPSGLQGLGYDSETFISLLRAHDFLFYNLGAGGETKARDLKMVGNPFLLDLFTVENKLFTNLMLVKGYTKMSSLIRATRQKNRALSLDTPELLAALRQWEKEIRASAEEEASGKTHLPAEVLAALQTEAERRSAEQEETIRAHFVSVTPLLSDARAEFEEAQAAAEKFQASVWETHGRSLADPANRR